MEQTVGFVAMRIENGASMTGVQQLLGNPGEVVRFAGIGSADHVRMRAQVRRPCGQRTAVRTKTERDQPPRGIGALHGIEARRET